MLRKTLLACDILSSVLYVGADLIAAVRFPGYHSFISQAVSELTAVGAPTKGSVEPFFIAVGASLFGRRFRLYSIATLLTLLVFGTWTGIEAGRLAAGQPTPWLGAGERIHIGAYLLWVVVLAFTIRRSTVPPALSGSERAVRMADAISWPAGAPRP